MPGAAYVFQRNQGGADNWGEVKKLAASDAQAVDLFGVSVAVSGNDAVVGALREDTGGNDAGAAYVFQRNQGGADNWGEVTKLTASDAETYDYFGGSVAVSGDTAVVGAWGADAGGVSAGAAYVFQRNEGGTNNWGELNKLLASDAPASDLFGISVAVSGDTAVVGAIGEDAGGSSAGAAYVFRRNQSGTNNWGELNKLLASDAQASDWFGYSVAVNGDTAVVGARGEAAGGSIAGAAYVFDLLQPKEQLAEKYAPVLYLARQDTQCDNTTDTDPYDPVAVEALLGQQEVRLMKNNITGDTPVMSAPTAADLFNSATGHYLDILENSHPRNASDRCNYETAYRNEVQAGANKAVYARVLGPGEADVPANRVVLQYWFFYYFDDWTGNRHEGDWELIQVNFPATSVQDIVDATPIDPDWVAFSQHTTEDGRLVAWGSVQQEPEAGSHPVVYVAAGSHANYARPGRWHAEVAGWQDGCDYAPAQGDARRLDDTGYQLQVLPDNWAKGEFYSWLEFAGEWGELSIPGFTGPGSPLTQAWGSNPWAWSQNLPQGADSPCVEREESQPRDFGSSVLDNLETFITQATITAGDIAVFLITWEGSEVTLTLGSPSGGIVDSATTDPNVTHEKGAAYEVFRVVEAETGMWTMEIVGTDLSGGPELVTWEAYEVAPTCGDAAAGDPALDSDLDGLTNGEEGSLGTDLCLWDTDVDRCGDNKELGADETLGGLRDPLNPWDFYDVETISGPGQDGVIDLAFDILSVIQHYAPTGDPPYDVDYDRGPSAGPNAWNMTAPDGVIDLANDILGVIQQYGHDCT